MVYETTRTAQDEVIYLTNACGEETGFGTIELTEADYAKVPFEDGPGYVIPYVIEIAGRAYVLGNLEVPYAHEDWGKDGTDYPDKRQVQTYCEAAYAFIQPRLTAGAMLLPVQDLNEGCLIVRVAIPLDGLADRTATGKALAQAFGLVADLPDLPFVDGPAAPHSGEAHNAEEYSMARIVEVDMVRLVGDYCTPNGVAEWRWIESVASFAHRYNGQEPGVWEFVLNLAMALDDIPPRLAPVLDAARREGAAYVLFHQG